MLTLLQYVEPASNEAEARLMLAGLALQVDYRGGRVLAPGPGKPDWRVQAFFDNAPGEWFPDGVRRVTVPASLVRSLGITGGP